MSKKKVSILVIIVIIVISLIVFFTFWIKKDNKSDESFIEDSSEEELTGLIDNEQYYYDRQKEYEETFDEYEELVKRFASEKFTEEQKAKISEYQVKMTEAANNYDNVTQEKLSKEYVQLYQEYMQKQFSEEQLKIVKDKNDIIDELEPIVIEYQELIEKAREEKSKQGLETLEDGRIKSNRPGIVSDKEYDGVKFSEIQLIYNPETDKTVLYMKATNTTDETKGNKFVTLHFTGNPEGTFLMMLNEIPKDEYDIIEFPLNEDLRDTDVFEIIDFNENDYIKR